MIYKTYTENRYWKTPNEQNHSSWIPRIQFDLFYDDSETIHYKVEWLNPDGSLWFSVPVENRQGYRTEGADSVLDILARERKSETKIRWQASPRAL